MKKSKKWIIYVACYLVTLAVMSGFTELYLSKDQTPKAEQPQQEAEPAWQPTAVIHLDNDNPYAYQGQEFDGTLYLYQDRNLAIINPRQNQGKVFSFFSIEKEKSGGIKLVGRGYGQADKNGNFTLKDNDKIPPLFIGNLKDGEPIKESSVNTLYKKYLVRLLPNSPAPFKTGVLKEALSHISPDYTAPEEPDYDQIRHQEWLAKQQMLQYQPAVFYSLLGVTIVAVLLALFLGFDYKEWQEENRHTPRESYRMDRDGNIRLSRVWDEMPKFISISNVIAIVLAVVILIPMTIPALSKVIMVNLYSGFFEGLGAIVMSIAIVVSMLLSFFVLGEHAEAAEGSDTDNGTLLDIFEICACVLFNINALIIVPVSIIPLLVINLMLAVPSTIIAFATTEKKTAVHWLIPFNTALKWLFASMLLAIVVIAYIWQIILKLKADSDRAEAASASRRRAEEGNDFLVTDADGKTVHMHRIGDSDDFSCGSNDQTYYYSGGTFHKNPH